MLATLLCESAKTVVNMNSLILVLFVGATIALAEIHVGNDPPPPPRPTGKPPRPPRPSGVSPRPPRPSGVGPRPPPPVVVSLVCFVNI